jgi:hypothetical protein
MIMVLGLSFFAVLKLTIYQTEYKEAADVLLSIFFSIIIEGVNIILGIYIDYSTDLEGRYTKTGQISNKIIKKILGSFLNATLIPFSLLIIESYRTSESEEDIIRNILTLFLLSNIISPVVSEFLQLPILLKLYKRRKIMSEGNTLLTQEKITLRHKSARILSLNVSILTYRIDTVWFAKEWPCVSSMPVSFQ